MIKNDIKMLSLFGGIDGFALGFERAGWNIIEHHYSEIDKHASAITKINFPNHINHGSVKHISGREFPNGIDVITFGSPCQDFSLAGKREGIEGERSSLIRDALRLVRTLRPAVFIWENVKGTFSSNDGSDFWSILQSIADIGDYDCEWELLNTSRTLPQNRERIYLIGHLTNRSKGGLFPLRESYGLPKESQRGEEGEREICSTVTSNLRKGVHNGGETYVKVTNLVGGEIARTIRGGGRGTHTAKHNWDTIEINDERVRVLTEIECERLQGFPDDWTKFGDYNGQIREVAKTQRYKCIGNSVTVDIVQTIASQLVIENDYI